jgi:hypothetical protein
MRGVKSFAYDLIVPYGGVSSRVALLLRSTEPKPSWPRFEKSLHVYILFTGLFMGFIVGVGCIATFVDSIS